MPGKKGETQSHYFIYFKKMYEAWEGSMSHAMEMWLKSPLFMNSVMNAAEKSAEFSRYMSGVMERTLKHKRLDTKYRIDKTGNSSDKTVEGTGRSSERAESKKRKQKSRRNDQ